MNKSLTIGIFVEHYDPFISGVVTSIKGLSAELESRGHSVYIICPSVKGHEDSTDKIIRIPSIATRASDNTTIGLPSPATIRRLMKIKFDIIHSHDVFYTAGVGLIIARKQKIPYIQTYHTLWHRFIEQYELGLGFKMGSMLAMAASYPFFFGFGTTKDFIRHYKLQAGDNGFSNLMWGHIVNMSRQADAVVVPSKHLQKDLLRSGLNVKIHQVPNGVAPLSVETESILPPKSNKKLRVLSVARFSSEKRLHLLVESLKHAPKNVELIMAGDGPQLGLVESLALDLGVSGRIRFMGRLSNGAVRILMRECDALALASYNFDNQPMVILEAVEAGLPIIYCDPRLDEGLNKRNAILARNNPLGFADAFYQLTDLQKLSSMRAASKKMFNDYSMPNVANKILDVYETSLTTNRFPA